MREIPSWQETFLKIVKDWGDRSKCQHYQIGAIFVRDKIVIMSGYNGPSAGDEHCNEVGCAKEVNGAMIPPGSKLCRGAHAEMNAIAIAAKHGINLSGTDVYCEYSPCYDCAKHLNTLGIKAFYYIKCYEEEFSQVSRLFARVGIKLIQIKRKGE
jgi:dCMP deaminase